MRNETGRKTANGRLARPTSVERPLPMDGWIESSLETIVIGDLVTLKMMQPFDDGDGSPRLVHRPGQPSFAIRSGFAFTARVVGDDLDNDGAMLVERIETVGRPDQRLLIPPVLLSMSARDLERRGAWVYRHRDHGPSDRSGATGARHLHALLLDAAGGGYDDPIAVQRVASCVRPETSTGAAAAKMGVVRAEAMLRGETAFSETVYAQLRAMPQIVKPKAKPAKATGKPRSPSSRATVPTSGSEDNKAAPQLVNGPRDAVLSLRWEMCGHWDRIRDVIPGISKAGAAIAISAWQEAITGGRAVSYSRTASHYEGRPKSDLYTLEKVKTGVEILDREGLLTDHFRQSKGCRGRQSHLRASDELVKIVSGTMGPTARLVPRRPGSAVVIRDAAGGSMALPETRSFTRQVQRVEAINEHLRSADLSHGVGACYTRIYHGSLDRGGRWYADGMSWQNLKSSLRSLIRIDGEETVELDYVTAHAAMIYADAGVALPNDAYAIEGWPRKLAKVAFLTMLNARSRRGAIGSLAHGGLIAVTGVVPGTTAALEMAARLVDAVASAHRQVESAFFSDAGAALMKRDADIAEDVMWAMTRAGITTLGVHDSVIVRASHADVLREAMMQAANDAGVPSMRIGVA